jgi:cell division protein FtsA
MRKVQEQHLIAGLDIGSTATRLVVGQQVDRGGVEGTELQILGVAEQPTQGVHKGVISSIEDVVSSISGCLEQAERMAGVPVDTVWVGASGSHIITQMSKGVVAVAKPDSEITEDDVARAVEASRSVAAPMNFEVLHVLPKIFSIDGQGGVKDPVGMSGIRLEVDTQIILGSASQVKNLTKAIYRTGLEIEDLVYSVLATAEAVITNRQRDLGVAVVNIGASTTSIGVFEEGDLLHTAVLPIGSEHITNDIAIGLRTSIDIAEAVKLNYVDCSSNSFGKNEEFDLYDAGSLDYEMIKRYYLQEIVQARVEEIFKKIDREFAVAKRSGMLPAGVVFTGSGAKLPGFTEVAKRLLKLPATLGYPLGVLSVTDKVNDIGFATAVGLVKWGSAIGSHTPHARRSGGGFNLKNLGGVGEQVKKWFKALIP